MSKISSSFSVIRFSLISSLVLGSLLVNKNAFSRQNWNADFMEVSYNPCENTIKFLFEVFDYTFGPANESGYLRWCDFFYSTDGIDYHHLMRAETGDQGYITLDSWTWDSWTWLIMRYKRPQAQLQFIGCIHPTNGVLWPDTGEDQMVEVRSRQKAYFTVKWFLGETYKDIKCIRLNGFWKVNGVYRGDDINNVYYDLPCREMLKSNALKDIPLELKSVMSTAVKVSKQADAINIKGVVPGENIKVYNVSGAEIKSIVASNEEVNIKLAKNEIYLVKVGQASYKVAL